MAQDEVKQPEYRRAKRRKKRKSREREKFMHNLKWILGGTAVGLPVLAILIYAVSNI